MVNEIKYTKELANGAAVVIIDGIVVKNRYDIFVTSGKVEEMKRKRENIVIQEGEIVHCYFDDNKKYLIINLLDNLNKYYRDKIIFY